MNNGIVNDNTIQQLLNMDSKVFLKDFNLTKNQRIELNADSYFFDVDKRIKLIRRYYAIKEDPNNQLGDRG